MGILNIRSLLLAAIVICNCITWTSSRHHYTHNVTGHRSRHRRQGAGLFLSSSYVLPGGEGFGAWGEWGEISPCSRTCGGGVASQRRICLEISPQGQPQCSGGDTKYFSCQTQDCPEGSVDFRAEQCAEFDDKVFRHNKYNWVPYTKGINPCELNCMPRGERFYYRHKAKVVDGTRCNDESFDVCVDGVCQPVGCDMMLGSNAREDKCRQCRGNGTNCRTIGGVIDTQDLRKGYNDILLIPEGATSIVIAEARASDNYLALRSKEDNIYYLNGDYHIDFPRSLMIAGALWHYERSQQGYAAPDELRCLGPTTEPLYLSLLLQSTNVGINYEYSVPTALAPPPNQQYQWAHEEFSECTQSCGGGYQTREVTCRSRDDLELVDDKLCDSSFKPDTNQTCNKQACSPEWVTEPWGPCSKPCGDGGTRSRQVYCQKIITNGDTLRYSSLVADKECFDILGAKPELYQECNQNETCPTWFTGPWKPCDKLCGEGKQTRQVVCHQRINGRVKVYEDNECADDKPPAEQPCELHPCDGLDWVLTEWTGCDSCLSTIRSRTALCVTKGHEIVNSSLCSYHPVPVLQEPCDKTKLPACEVQWYATQWSPCSVECGKGIQTRKVFCGLFDGASVLKVDDGRCDKLLKYNDTKECEVSKDKCPAKWYAGPWSECTKKCGGGEQYRQTLCLTGDKKVGHCDEETILDSTQPCNIGPCDKDEMLPVDSRSTVVMDEDEDYDDCVEEEEDYPEVGAEIIESKTTSFEDLMFSDFSFNMAEGSNEELSGIESRFTDETGSGSEAEGSGADFSTFETTPLSTESTDSTESDLTTEGSTESSSGSIITEQTSEITESSVMSTEQTATTESSVITEQTEIITEVSESSGVTTEQTETTVEMTEYSGSITEQTETTEFSGETTVQTESTSEITGFSGSTTEQIETTSEIADSSDVSTEQSSTTIESYSVSTDQTLTTSDVTESSETTTEQSEMTSEITETSGSSTEQTEITSEITESSDITTEQTETTSEITLASEVTTEQTEITSEMTESSGSTTEQTETTEFSGETTEQSETTQETTEPTETTGFSGETTEQTETTEEITKTTEPTETTVSSGETTEESETTQKTTEPTETTKFSVETTEQTETTSEITELSGKTTEQTETTESSGSSTENVQITDSSTISTEQTEVTSEITETSTAHTEESTSITETSESGSTTESSSTTETISEGTSTTEETESMVAGSTTPWDWSSTVEVYTTKRHCKPRRKPKCIRSKFGCCPDKRTPAAGPFDEGCPSPETCKESTFGCCPDGVSPATGPQNKDCPITPCNETLFGCCRSDNVTAAEGNDQEGCPPPPPACQLSKFGCCKDKKTNAKGRQGEGCPETETIKPVEKTQPSIETPSDCSKSTYGCCYDNETDASGPNGEGCPCSISEFGCCPDGISTALGVNMEGCVMSCNTSAYGCCPDGETPAHGPEYEGCCILTAFGCCPDNYKPAEGPHREGCDCQHAHFGCCPDNKTIARGPDKEGCGCEHTEFGCCLDRHTAAKGPELEGCGCHTYQFGCCPDGETRAVGPDQQGCRCSDTKYGCCGDDTTAATGPDGEGCDCTNSKYGCCPDGVTEAKGKNFLNCTDVIENRQAACSLANDKGSCRNFTVHWYYDQDYGGCSRFWYSGCEGNDNRFRSLEECEDVCVHPSPKDACNLPMVKGACNGHHVHWYYDSAREQCSQFVYSGCLGNDNNFNSRELCQKQCEPEKTEDQCNLPPERGPCEGNYLRWFYNVETRSCIKFVWGGCGGNSNRFTTEVACKFRCNPPDTPEDKCTLTQDAGNCTEKNPVWSFNQNENGCVPFYYTGCGGNDNRFSSEQECASSCPSAYVQEVCTLPASTGNCADYTLRWFYDTAKKTCRQFYYGGCGGNENNFMSINECENRCMEQQITTTVRPVPQNAYTTEYCYMDRDPGPCTQFETKWAYDERTGICTTFSYGGCGGNRNNFPSLEYCQYYCGATTDICQLPMVTGPCEESLMRWFYDSSTDTCSRFAYGGCEGNDNRFNTLEECENRCRAGGARTAPPTTTVVYDSQQSVKSECRISSSLEECREPGRVWFYDQSLRSCQSHDNSNQGAYCRYTGVFKSEEACERACGYFQNLNVCSYGLNAGTCTSAIPKYYFSSETGRCEQFMFSGCHGGPNRFSTLEECEEICRPDPCTLPAEPGNCVDYLERWYYNQERDDCEQFVYGGCNGNDNRFETHEECVNFCKSPPTTAVTSAPPVRTTTVNAVTSPERLVDPECRAPESLLPCGESVRAYYYDARTRSCVAGDFGSCRYPNSYRTEEECERRCGAFRGLDVCGARLDSGPCLGSYSKVYWDAAAGRCLPFNYGGCLGGPNRFSYEDECYEVCGSSGPEAVCQLPVETGQACGAPMRRWYYSAGDGDCLPFVYFGCNGNYNNFHSYQECALYCKISNGINEAPSANSETVPEVSGSVGGMATLRCLFHGNPPPKITWRRGEITIDHDYARYKLLSDGALEIASLYRNDSGVYICIAENNLGRVTQEIRLDVNDCKEYMVECAALRCEYGVQRTATADGCQRCSCVSVEVDCRSLQEECDNLLCNYGMESKVGDDGCRRCRCKYHPCSSKECPDGERCAFNIYEDPITKDERYYAECRVANKTGYCPIEDQASSESQCRQECYDDADCVGVGKCCSRGCSQLCLAPATRNPLPDTYSPDEPRAPMVNAATEPEVTASEGDKATLRCLFHGNPPPKITWRKQEITIDGDTDRYRLLSDGALEIVSLYRNDSGVYICIAQNDLGNASQEIRLEVNDPVRRPAGIAGTQDEVLYGEPDQPLSVRCLAYGYPKPLIYWYRGSSGPMVPYSDVHYEARENILLIKRLNSETFGEYICQAYNGEGKPAQWSFTVQSRMPPASHDVVLPQTTEVPETTSTTPATTTLVPIFSVPVTTSVLATSTRLKAGYEINLPCAVDGYPVPEVYWTKDGVRLSSDDRLIVTDARLTVSQANTNDSGVYGCHASNGYSSHSSTVQVTVEGLYIPPTCVDNPFFANCQLIVKSKFCLHKYYSSFCCKSCVEAGLLDPMQLDLQAEQPWFKRK